MNYEEDDKNKVCMKIFENILNMVHWMMMVNEKSCESYIFTAFMSSYRLLSKNRL